MGYVKDDTVVIRGMGLGKVKRVGNDGWIDVLPSNEGAELLELSPDGVEKRIRPVVDRATAERLVQLLSKKEGKTDARSWGEQYVELQRALRNSDAEPMAEMLQRLYRTERPLPATVERVIENFEDALLPELAYVLSKSVPLLRGQFHKAQPAFGYSAPERPEAPPAPLPKKLPEGWACLGTFRAFSGKLVIGEATESDVEATFPGRSFRTNLTVQARNGDWFAMVKKGEWVGVFVHADAVKGFEKRLGETRELGKVMIGGGTLGVLDEEVRGDRAFQRAQALGGNESVDGRGFVIAVGGDATLPVLAVLDGKDAVIVAAQSE